MILERPSLSAIFLVTFDITRGNEIEYQYPEDLELGGLEFNAIPSGLHKVRQDTIYFHYNGYYGLSVFFNEESSNNVRGSEMKAVGILQKSCHNLHEHIQPLIHLYKNEKDHFHEKLKIYFQLFNSKLSEQDNLLELDDIPPVFNPYPSIEHLIDSIDPFQDNPQMVLSQMVDFYGPSIYVIWKAIMLQCRILFLIEPPVLNACQQIYCLSMMAGTLKVLGSSDIPALYLVGVLDIPNLSNLKSYIACTTDRIFQCKSNLFDVLVKIDSFSSQFSIHTTNPHLSTLNQINFYDEERYSKELLTFFESKPPVPPVLYQDSYTSFDSFSLLRDYDQYQSQESEDINMELSKYFHSLIVNTVTTLESLCSMKKYQGSVIYPSDIHQIGFHPWHDFELIRSLLEMYAPNDLIQNLCIVRGFYYNNLFSSFLDWSAKLLCYFPVHTTHPSSDE